MSTLVGGIMYSICIYTVFLICNCFCPFFFFILKNLILKRHTKKGQWYQHLLTVFVNLYKSNTEGTNFRIMFICLTFVKCACFVLYSTCLRFELVKSPEVTVCG